MKKYIIIDTPHGQYKLPLILIAEDRAEYYSKVDFFSKGTKQWNDEVNQVMEDDFEGIDWLINNSDWEDWENKAQKINDLVKVTEDDFWTSSENFEIKSL